MRLLFSATRLFAIKTISHILIKRSSNTPVQLFRYACAGGIALAADVGSLVILTECLGIYYLLSSALAYLMGVITKYALCVAWVFDKRAIRSRWMEFIVFGLIGVAGFGLNVFFMWFFTEQVHLHYLASKIISAGAVFFWNFFTRKFILFF